MNCVLDWIIECFFKGNTWPHQVLHRAGHALASSSSSWGHNLGQLWMLWISAALWNHSASRSWPLLVCCYYSSSASAVAGRPGAPETATKTSGMTQTPHFLVFAFALSAGMACLAIFNIFSNAKLGTIWIAWIHGSPATAGVWPSIWLEADCNEEAKLWIWKAKHTEVFRQWNLWIREFKEWEG